MLGVGCCSGEKKTFDPIRISQPAEDLEIYDYVFDFAFAVAVKVNINTTFEMGSRHLLRQSVSRSTFVLFLICVQAGLARIYVFLYCLLRFCHDNKKMNRMHGFMCLREKLGRLNIMGDVGGLGA